jgi:Na+-transporting NADH:ubiquinone oxidoreductase subunit C
VSRRVESLGGTLAVAAAVALVCSLLVSTAVYFLRPFELAYSAVERNRAILEAAGRAPVEGAVTDREVVERFLELETRIADLSTGSFTQAIDAASYDFRAAADDPGMRVAIPAADDVAGLSTRPRYMPVHLAFDDDRVSRIVLPIYARGMWSTIYGYVALAADMETIAGVSFYEHGETAGIGDRIKNPDWLGGWRGKRLYGPDGALRFRIATRAETVPAEYRVDSITGATVTVSSIDRAMRYWFSEHGYRPLLERLKNRGF